MDSVHINLWEVVWNAGFVVKFVLMLLLLASIVSWGIIFKKRSLLASFENENKKFFDLYVQSSNMEELMENCSSFPSSPYRSLFMYGFGELIKLSQNQKVRSELQGNNFLKQNALTLVTRGLKQGENQVNEILDEYLPILASIGSVTPFVGLLGTVWGIIDSFTGIASKGATLDKVAPGIAEALVATAIGLFAAIPAVWFFNYFTNRIARINLQMENFKQDFLNTLERTLID